MSLLQSLVLAGAYLCVLVMARVLTRRREATRPVPTIRLRPVNPANPPDPLHTRSRRKPDGVRREVLHLAALPGPGAGCRSKCPSTTPGPLI